MSSNEKRILGDHIIGLQRRLHSVLHDFPHDQIFVLDRLLKSHVAHLRRIQLEQTANIPSTHDSIVFLSQGSMSEQDAPNGDKQKTQSSSTQPNLGRPISLQSPFISKLHSVAPSTPAHSTSSSAFEMAFSPSNLSSASSRKMFFSPRSAVASPQHTSLVAPAEEEWELSKLVDGEENTPIIYKVNDTLRRPSSPSKEFDYQRRLHREDRRRRSKTAVTAAFLTPEQRRARLLEIQRLKQLLIAEEMLLCPDGHTVFYTDAVASSSAVEHALSQKLPAEWNSSNLVTSTTSTSDKCQTTEAAHILLQASGDSPLMTPVKPAQVRSSPEDERVPETEDIPEAEEVLERAPHDDSEDDESKDGDAGISTKTLAQIAALSESLVRPDHRSSSDSLAASMAKLSLNPAAKQVPEIANAKHSHLIVDTSAFKAESRSVRPQECPLYRIAERRQRRQQQHTRNLIKNSLSSPSSATAISALSAAASVSRLDAEEDGACYTATLQRLRVPGVRQYSVEYTESSTAPSSSSSESEESDDSDGNGGKRVRRARFAGISPKEIREDVELDEVDDEDEDSNRADEGEHEDDDEDDNDEHVDEDQEDEDHVEEDEDEHEDEHEDEDEVDEEHEEEDVDVEEDVDADEDEHQSHEEHEDADEDEEAQEEDEVESAKEISEKTESEDEDAEVHESADEDEVYLTGDEAEEDVDQEDVEDVEEEDQEHQDEDEDHDAEEDAEEDEDNDKTESEVSEHDSEASEDSALRFDDQVSSDTEDSSDDNNKDGKFPYERNVIALSHSYDLVRRLATNSDTVVYEGYCRATGRHVAIKVRDEWSRRRHDTELRMFAAVQGCKLFPGLVAWHRFRDTKTVAIAMEYCGSSDISVLFNSPWAIKQYTLSMLLALQHLHTRNILYRDIKPSNIMWDEDKSQARIIDFDVSTFSSEYKGRLHRRYVGTDGYMSPELVLVKKCRKEKRPCIYQGYGFSTDAFSAGVIFAQLIYRKYEEDITDDDNHYCKADHFRAQAMEELEALRENGTQPSFDPRALEIVVGLLHPEPSQRMSVSEAVGHEYFKDCYFDEKDGVVRLIEESE